MGEPVAKLEADSIAELLSQLSIGNVLADQEERLEAGVVRMETGFPRLDAALGGGLEVPSLNVIGAPPKAFKSTFSQMLAEEWIRQDGAVYYLDLENGPRRFLRRLLCRSAKVSMSTVAAALENRNAGAFDSREELARWATAKDRLQGPLAGSLFVEFRPPKDLAGRLANMRRAVGDRRLLVVIDSLQKLPQDFDDRRSSIDKWVRLFERLRYELNATFWVVSEIKRGRDGYDAREDAFKESGGIEYAADLALTLNRPSADEDPDAPATLRVELARDCEEDPRGEVASYLPVRPWYGLEEINPVPIAKSRRRRGHGPEPVKAQGAVEFLQRRLTDGAAAVTDILRDGEAAGFSESTIRRAGRTLGLVSCTVQLKTGWRLP